MGVPVGGGPCRPPPPAPSAPASSVTFTAGEPRGWPFGLAAQPSSVPRQPVSTYSALPQPPGAVSKTKVPLRGAVHRCARSCCNSAPQVPWKPSPEAAVSPWKVTGSALPRSWFAQPRPPQPGLAVAVRVRAVHPAVPVVVHVVEARARLALAQLVDVQLEVARAEAVRARRVHHHQHRLPRRQRHRHPRAAAVADAVRGARQLRAPAAPAPHRHQRAQGRARRVEGEGAALRRRPAEAPVRRQAAPARGLWSSSAKAVEPFTVTGSALPSSRSTQTAAASLAQTLGMPLAPQDSGAVQVPQSSVPRSPSGTAPQFFPRRPQVYGRHAGARRRWARRPRRTSRPAAQVPHSSVPPHPSGTGPQSFPSASHVAGVQGGGPHTLGTPPPPHVSGAVHAPHSSTPPHPSGTGPQFFPSTSHVAGVHAPPPQTLGSPPPPHVCPSRAGAARQQPTTAIRQAAAVAAQGLARARRTGARRTRWAPSRHRTSGLLGAGAAVEHAATPVRHRPASSSPAPRTSPPRRPVAAQVGRAASAARLPRAAGPTLHRPAAPVRHGAAVLAQPRAGVRYTGRPAAGVGRAASATRLRRGARPAFEHPAAPVRHLAAVAPEGLTRQGHARPGAAHVVLATAAARLAGGAGAAVAACRRSRRWLTPQSRPCEAHVMRLAVGGPAPPAPRRVRRRPLPVHAAPQPRRHAQNPARRSPSPRMSARRTLCRRPRDNVVSHDAVPSARCAPVWPVDRRAPWSPGGAVSPGDRREPCVSPRTGAAHARAMGRAPGSRECATRGTAGGRSGPSACARRSRRGGRRGAEWGGRGRSRSGWAWALARCWWRSCSRAPRCWRCCRCAPATRRAS